MSRQRLRQAHRLPPKKWEQALFVTCLFLILLIVVTFVDPSFHL